MTFLNLDLGTPIVRAADTVTGDLGALGARFIMDGRPADGRFSLVELVVDALAAGVADVAAKSHGHRDGRARGRHRRCLRVWRSNSHPNQMTINAITPSRTL